MSKVEIGQTLYEPPRRGFGSMREHKVAKIGRVWITFHGGERCSINRLMLDCGGYTPRQLYTSPDEYQSITRLAAAWTGLKRYLVHAARPEGMTVERINEIRALLGLEGERNG